MQYSSNIIKFVFPYIDCDLCNGERNCAKYVCKHRRIVCLQKHICCRKKIRYDAYMFPLSYQDILVKTVRRFRNNPQTKCSVCSDSENVNHDICMGFYKLDIEFHYNDGIRPIFLSYHGQLVIWKFVKTRVQESFNVKSSLIFPVCCKHNEKDILKAFRYKTICGFTLVKNLSKKFKRMKIIGYSFQKTKFIIDGEEFFLIFSKNTLKCSYCGLHFTELDRDCVYMSANGYLKKQWFCGECYTSHKHDS